VKELKAKFPEANGPDVCIDCAGACTVGWVDCAKYRRCHSFARLPHPPVYRRCRRPRAGFRFTSKDAAGLLNRIERMVRLETDAPNIFNEMIHAVRMRGR
jgi:hypothetical protein